MARLSVHVYLMFLVGGGVQSFSVLKDIVLYRPSPRADSRSRNDPLWNPLTPSATSTPADSRDILHGAESTQLVTPPSTHFPEGGASDVPTRLRPSHPLTSRDELSHPLTSRDELSHPLTSRDVHPPLLSAPATSPASAAATTGNHHPTLSASAVYSGTLPSSSLPSSPAHATFDNTNDPSLSASRSSSSSSSFSSSPQLASPENVDDIFSLATSIELSATQPTIPTSPTQPPVPTSPSQTTIPTSPTQPTIPTSPTQAPVPTSPTQTTIPTSPTQPPKHTSPTQPTIPTSPTQPPVHTPPTQPTILTSPTRPPVNSDLNVQFNDSLACHVLKTTVTWLRHPGNCSRYFVCTGGQVQEMAACRDGKVFSLKTRQCVRPHSPHDDCEEMFFSFPAILLPHLSGRLLWHPQYSQQRDATPRLQSQATPLMAVSKADTSTETPRAPSPQTRLNSTRACDGRQQGVHPHPDNCAWFYDCSVTPDAVMDTFYGGHVMECPYPQLFSLTSLQCEDFEDVDCRGRYEPVSPCEYRANHCHETSHCIPCWVRYASCQGRQDGLNAWPELEWRPFFVECFRQRTVFQGSCDKSSVFSPLTRACETPFSIPREHGGWRPSCQGRLDGKYPDEHGRCESFYTCANQIFTGYHSCPPSLKFDPVTASCHTASRVPYPCGDQDAGALCQGKADGQYLDAWGRCTHYYTCRDGEVQGVSLCPEGVFNSRTRSCDTSSSIAGPCGALPNPCLHKANGLYADVSRSCQEYYLCDNGLQAAVFSCDENTVFNDATQACEDVTVTQPPCGLAPSCVGRPDGRYPALGEGLHAYFTCLNGSLAGFTRCSHEDGGLAFSVLRKQCATPMSVCAEILGDSKLC